MKFILACKAFWKAWKQPKLAQQFLEEKMIVSDEKSDASHIRLLYDLQQSSRFIDFFKEDIDSFSDAQIGAAVRKIHQDCRQSLEELVAIRPLRDEEEGSSIQVPKEYDPAEIKVVGQIKGEPPFKGVLIHRGWKAQKHHLPNKKMGVAQHIICPAEVEIRG
jgi:hypothetical protein